MMFTTKKTLRNASLGVVLAGFALMTGGCVSSVEVAVTPASLKVEGVVQVQKGLTTDINYNGSKAPVHNETPKDSTTEQDTSTPTTQE